MTGPVKLIVIDSFCGAGGWTEGVHRAKINEQKCAVVVIGINHDAKAIESHAANHPETKHFTEDFRKIDPMDLLSIVEAAKRKYRGAKVVFHMSAECTHHSKAKGGESRDADSRSLPEYIDRYIDALKPDIITVENVVEFIDWGPLQIKVKKDKQGNELYCPLDIKKDKKTKKVVSINPVWVPIPERKGEYYELWKEMIESYGYHYEYRKLNAADFSAFTSRTRYYGVFSLDPKNIAFPIPTHSKDGKNGLKKWNAVKDVLNLCDEGESIFDRKKDPVDPTFERVYAGLLKFVDDGAWMLKYNSKNGKTGKHVAPGINTPCPTVSCQNRLGVVQTKFIQTYYGNGGTRTIDEPCPTITTKDRCALVDPVFIISYNFKDKPKSVDCPFPTLLTKDRYAIAKSQFMTNSYSGGGKIGSIKEPCPSVMTVPKQNLTTCYFIDQQYGNSKPASIHKPAGSVTANPKFALVSSKQPWLMDTNYRNIGTRIEDPSPVITANRKYHYLVNPQFNSSGWSIDRPCFTLIARMDKRPPGLVTTISDGAKLPSFIKREGDTLIYHIYDTDTPIVKKIKEFMAAHGITDILMRMLRIDELLRIMGFGDSYILKGTQTDKKKFIGNAVECTQAKVIAEAIAATI